MINNWLNKKGIEKPEQLVRFGPVGQKSLHVLQAG